MLWPIIDTIDTPYYDVGKFLSSLLNPLTVNEYSLSHSFDVVSNIRNIPKSIFTEGYKFVSFDVELLFTNVPLAKTVNIILDRIYNGNQINTTLKKQTLKKLISDCCSKTTFLFNNQLFEQTGGVSIGCSLGLVLANIILTEFEKNVVSDIIKFYKSYVDDTLVLIKPPAIPLVLNKFNQLDKNLKFTIDTFPDALIHFLHIKISPAGTGVYTVFIVVMQLNNFSGFQPLFD